MPDTPAAHATQTVRRNPRHVAYSIAMTEAKWWLGKAEHGHREASHRQCLEHAVTALIKAIALVPIVPQAEGRDVA